MAITAGKLRLMSDLKRISEEPPDVRAPFIFASLFHFLADFSPNKRVQPRARAAIATPRFQIRCPAESQ